MKYILLIFTLALVAFAFKPASEMPAAEYTGTADDGVTAYEPTLSKNIRFQFDLDTITNAANDTLSVPYNLFSEFSGTFNIVRTNISGTTNIAVTLQSSAVTSGSDWCDVASTSATTATPEAITVSSMPGVRYRLIVDGTGTQSSSYYINGSLKKLN